jgi:ABC-2 type transport system ATP-binding protein
MNESRSSAAAPGPPASGARPVLEVESLVKRFGARPAVEGLTFRLGAGEFAGLLGPNGAGKTTTIKMLTGLLRPDAGWIRYGGLDFEDAPREAKRRIGVVPQANNLDRDLTARENLTLHAILHGLPAAERRRRIAAALRFAGLEADADRPVGSFSGGMGRRLVIVRALLHEPEILFLDEPTAGLDPQIRRDLWDLIIRVNRERGTAILLTTHYIEEAERLCARVLILDEGRLVAEGAPGDLKKGVGPFVLETTREDGLTETFHESREAAVAALAACAATCKVREATLEDVFLQLTGRRIER